MAAHKGPPRKARNPKQLAKVWEPTAIQLEWYRKWVEEAKGPTQIASENHCGVSRSVVCKAIHKVAAWVRQQTLTEIMDHRDRMVMQYEQVMRDAWSKWNASQGEVVVIQDTEGGEFPTTRTTTKMSHGDTAYLQAFLQAGRQIQDIMGVNAAVKSEAIVRHAEEIPDLPQGQGHASRSEALKAAAAAIIAVAERQAVIEQANKQARAV